MTTYRKYQEARNAAWRALLRLDEKKLPVDVAGLAARVGVQAHPWPDDKENPELKRLADQVGGLCASLRIQGAWHLFLRVDELDERTARFAVAHELGHLLLRHDTVALSPGVRRFLSQENRGDVLEDPREMTDYAADIFASRLLSPACVLRDAGVDTAEKIAALCGMPPRASALRAERMAELVLRDAFYRNPLEKQVRRAFDPWLNSLPPPAAPDARKKRRGGVLIRYARWAGPLLLLAALILLFLLGKQE